MASSPLPHRLALASAVTAYTPGGFGGTISAPAGTDSDAGTKLLTKHFPSSAANLLRHQLDRRFHDRGQFGGTGPHHAGWGAYVVKKTDAADR